MKLGTIAAVVTILLVAASAEAQTLVRYGRFIQEQAPIQADAVQAPTQAPVQAPKMEAEMGCGCGMGHDWSLGCGSNCSGWWSNYSRPRASLGLARFAGRGCGACGTWAPTCGAMPATCSPCCGHGHKFLRGCGRCHWGWGLSSDCGCGMSHEGKDMHDAPMPMEAPVPMDVPTPEVGPTT